MMKVAAAAVVVAVMVEVPVMLCNFSVENFHLCQRALCPVESQSSQPHSVGQAAIIVVPIRSVGTQTPSLTLRPFRSTPLPPP